ncbi:DegT/DnrJ/EryC1/StrS family aminotransferase [Olleya sp. YSTF-M6]|uniref:DegT/DnrJ/EryC1/StrS family aminotransferase n=1 Tax=Olleya sediminilitoris TaxID=2795739 RepID=A0ABS1WIA6_9FLAO|nr:GntG family PLP-dependent aldolase [Olleya sediminilitoris]MBL7558846.1 DegT/DnrJ/EryC1/StrS family aminotransferase [Olleya sediminilitoris]
MIIDLRSDTVTKPSLEMMEAMMTAKVGDDVYKEDETINALEEKVAQQFGKSHAMFFPSGTMANQTALKLHTNPGDQVICDQYAHIYNYEGGGASFNSGISCKLLDGHRGMFTASQVEEAINPPEFYHSPLTTLVEIENTTNKGGGACWDFNEILKIKDLCKTHNLGFHLDGARLWNALVAKNETTVQYGAAFNTISVCLSKGLGCPIGSVLVGDEAIMKNAIRIRKILGGGMRQGGFLAAAGLYALEHNIERLEEDHIKAKQLGDVLLKSSFVKKVEPVETNIVIFQLNEKYSENDFLEVLSDKNIKIISMGNGKLRLVTHLNYSDNQHDKVVNVLEKL